MTDVLCLAASDRDIHENATGLKHRDVGLFVTDEHYFLQPTVKFSNVRHLTPSQMALSHTQTHCTNPQTDDS